MSQLVDIFSNDIFGVVSLTDAIMLLPEKPSLLGDMNLFEEKGVPTIVVTVEMKNGVLSLVQTSTRGTRGVEMKHAKRNQRPFIIPHIEAFDAVLADSVQGVRKFGQEANVMESVSEKVAERLQVMKDSIDMTKEWHRCGAIQGLVKDADGSTIYDFFSEFGLTRDSVGFNFSRKVNPGRDDPKTTASQILRLMQHSMGGTLVTGVQAIVGDNFWDAFIQSYGVKEGFLNYDNSFLKTQQNNGFPFGGIFWKNYSGKVGSTNVIPVNEAQFFPLNTSDTFKCYYGPADTIEAVNTDGEPIYAMQELMPHGKGVELASQSNPLYMVNRPKCLIKGTFDTNEAA